MHKEIETLYELCDTISRELNEANEKIRKAGGKLSAGDIDYIDRLTHSLKSIKTTIAMMEAEEGSGSYRGSSYTVNGYNMGNSRGYMGDHVSHESSSGYYEGTYNGSYGNRKRDSMGRYTRDDGIMEELKSLMHETRDDGTRRKIEKIMQEFGN